MTTASRRTTILGTMTEGIGRAHLEVELRDQPPTRVMLTETPLRIGRGPDNHVLIPDGHVSKRHAEITKAGDGFVITDLGSRAGVFLNGEQVSTHALADGDVIGLGAVVSARLVFRRERASKLDMTMFVARDASAEQGGMARLARFFEFSHKLGGGFSIEEVLRDVVDLAIEVTKAERGVLIVQRDDDSLETKVARGAGGRTLPREGLRVSETLVQKALALGKPSVFDDVMGDADLAQAASIVSLELRSAVTLPLLRFAAADGRDTGAMRVFGLIYLDSRRLRGGFDGFDLGILGRLASDASAVIENARLVREAEDRRRLEAELAMAREVQAALMPEQFRSTPAFEVAGTCVPCFELGGDYVDQFDLPGGKMALVVADVCGKGIAASLLAAALQGALAAEIATGRALSEAVARVNQVVCRLAPVGKFITMAIAVCEPNGQVELVNAGHCPVLHNQTSGTVGITTGGSALGLDKDAVYEAALLKLRPGDTLLLYTDGVIECEGPGRELFGDERLGQAIAQRGGSAAVVLGNLMQAMDQFRRGTPVTDDLSVVVLRRT